MANCLFENFIEFQLNELHRWSQCYVPITMCLLLPIIYCFIKIEYWHNRINIYDGPHEQHMKIGEVYGNSNTKLLKAISSSGKSMFIDFFKQFDMIDEKSKFMALFKYNKINFDCQTWLNANISILMSPNNTTYTNCSWLITANFRSYIILNFTFIEVNIYSCVILIISKLI